MAQKMLRLEAWSIPPDFDYGAAANITLEAREKLGKIQPDTLGQASRISGVSPADLSVLMVMLKKQGARPSADHPGETPHAEAFTDTIAASVSVQVAMADPASEPPARDVDGA